MIDTFYICMIFMYVWLEMYLVHFSTLYLSLFKGFYFCASRIVTHCLSSFFSKFQVSAHFTEHFSPPDQSQPMVF